MSALKYDKQYVMSKFEEMLTQVAYS
jgi:hypothetical protein